MLSRFVSARRRLTVFTALAGLVVLGYAVHVLFQASRALREASRQIASESNIRFESLTVRGSGASAIEPIPTSVALDDAVVFDGSLYVAGPASLTQYDSSGAVLRRYTVGPDLPGPLAALATGIASGRGVPELFIATYGEGLLAFDGRAFRQIRPVLVPYRSLTAVLPLPSGRVLLGTAKRGVLAYDGERITPFHPALNNVPITVLAGEESDVWIGTIDRGVIRWHAGEIQYFGEAEGLPDRHVLSVAVADGVAYAGTAMGVAEIRDGKLNRTLAQGFFARSLSVAKGTLSIGTLDEGVIEIPLAAAAPRPLRPEAETLPGAVVRLFERDGRKYALTDAGLYAQGPRSWERVLTAEQGVLSDRNIAALALDGRGRLWIGYFDRGLDILEPAGDRARHVENDHVFCVNRVVHDPERGVTAVATANGLVFFDGFGNQRQVIGRAEGLIANQVTDVLFSEQATVVATPAGITYLDGSGARSIYAFHGLVNNHAYSLASAGSRLLVGTLGGLSVLNGPSVAASYTTANSGLRHNWITAIVQAGPDWMVGTYGAGVLRLDAAGRWHSYADLPAHLVVNPNAMLATERAVYAGSLNAGLYVFNRASGRWTEFRSGLPSSNVTALAAGGGTLYIGTDNGAVRVVEQSLYSQ